MVYSRQAGDKESKVRGVVVLHTEVVHHQDKGCGSSGMAKKTGGVGLVKIKGLEKRNETEIGQLTGLFEAVHRFIDRCDK